MNIESAGIRAHKAVIEDIVGLKLIVIQKATGNITYELHDADNKYIKESRHLTTLVTFISIHFNYSYIDLEEDINKERLRLIKENHNTLKSAQQEAQVRINREKNKPKPKGYNSKPLKPYTTKCPHCDYQKCYIKKKDPTGYFVQYQCKNCFRTHIRDYANVVIKGDRKNVLKKFIKDNIELDIIDIMLEDNNITL